VIVLSVTCFHSHLFPHGQGHPACRMGDRSASSIGRSESERHIRTVPVPTWVKQTLDAWLTAAGIASGPLFRCVCRADKLWGSGISEKTVWHVVKKTATRMKIPQLSPHDLRRSCARLCHASGGELEQIQFLLGHVSVQTTERYIGCKQRFRVAVNDKLGIEPG
jgi:integrase